ncbi:MAG: Fic family protein [Chloroflexota bacterium]|nr:Fic family protein [Chloroflexota bacterium]
MQIVTGHADAALAARVAGAEALQAHLAAAEAFVAGAAVTAALQAAFIYHSARMQGNSMSAAEVATVRARGTVAGKSANEHQDIRNLDLSLSYVETLAGGEMPLTERLVRVLHALVMRDLTGEADASGSYRSSDLAHLSYPVPPAVDVVAAMGGFGRWLTLKPESAEYLASPILRATYAHTRLLTIHPFINGNGRTGRLLLNLLLLRAGFPPVALDSAAYPAYLHSLDAAGRDGDLTPILSLVLDAVERSLAAYV